MSERLVTVFGASGFIGRYVLRALARRGFRIRAAVRDPGSAHFLRPLGDVGQIQIQQANVRVAPTVERAVEGAWGVVNLVGVAHESGPQRFNSLHVMAAETIAAAAARSGAEALVHVSALGADEQSDSTYAKSKAEGERAVTAHFAEATILRPSIVFGPEDQFFNKFAAIARLSPVLPLFGGGRTLFQPVFAGDVGEAVARSLAEPNAPGRIYELGGPGIYSFRELMEAVLKATERRRVLLPLPWIAAKGVALGFVFVPGFIADPLITFDQVKLLQVANIVRPGMPGLSDLGISPRALEVELPAYLWRFRKAGQFEARSLA
jgi:uncharacterized protein YbjT (DUF2867 family)